VEGSTAKKGLKSTSRHKQKGNWNTSKAVDKAEKSQAKGLT